MNYKKAFASLLITSVLFISSLTGCGAAASADSTGSKADSGAVTKDSGSSSAESPDYGKTADASDMTDVDPVGEDWMTPIGHEGVVNGVYQAAVDSSSCMFKIKDCVLTVSDDSMTARLTMNGTGYLYVYMGTAEQAAKADEADFIPFEEDGNGAHTFTIPVKALDEGFPAGERRRRG